MVLNALFASLAWCLARPNVASMLSVVTFAVIWPFVDKPLGGQTIHVFDEANGITTGDFLTVLALGIVAFQAVRQFRRTQRKRAAAVPPSTVGGPVGAERLKPAVRRETLPPPTESRPDDAEAE